MGSGVEEGGLSRASLAQQQQKLSENPDSLHVHVEGESPTAAAKAVRSLDTRTFTEVGTPPDSREDNGLSDQTLEEAGHSGSSRHSNSPDSTSSHHVGHERKQQLQQQQTDLQDMRRGILNHLKHIGRDYAVGSDPSSREAKRMKALEATLRDVDILRKRVAQCLEEEEEVEEGTPLTSPHNATTATAGGGPPPPPPRGPKTQQTANDGLTTESSTSTTTTTTTTSSSSGNATPQQLSGTTPPTPTAADTAASPPAATPASPPVTMMKRPSVRPSSAAPRTEPTKSAEEDLSMKAYLASLMSASAVFVSHASNEKGGPMRPASAAPPSTTTTAAPSKAGGASQAPSRHNSRRPFSADYSNSAANSTGGSSGGSLDPSSDGIPSHLNVFLRKVPRPTHRRSDSADPSTEEGAEDVAPRPSLFARRSVPSSTASSAAEDSAAKPASPGVARPFSSLPRSTSFSSTGSSRRSSSASGAESDARHTTVQRLREKGNDFFQRQEYAKAVRVYSEGLRFDPLNDILCCNRAAANLLSFQFTAAVLDAKFVLLRSPNNLKANWRAAKGLLCTNRLPEARRYYRAARQICEEESSSPATTTNSSTVKWLKEKKAILAEEAAPDLVESYWSHMRQERWTEAYEAASQLISIFGGSGAASAPWRVKQLESLVFTDPNEAMTKVKALREEFPDFPDAMYLHAKALFYCAHDCDSTKLILELLNNVRQALESQNSQLEVNVRDFARHAQRTSSSPTASSGTNTSVEQIEGWLSTYRSTEDSRLVQLRRIVERFTHHRDEGNAAYGRSDWTLAYGAYTRCLQVDPRNKSLLATTYCNRAAVCMQAGRWKDALCDVNDAIRYNTTNEKAFARRARIYLHMVEHGSGGGSSASSQEQKSRYLTAAVDDLKRAVSINSTTELKTQLNEAMERRKAFLNDQSGTSQPRAASASTSSFGRSSRNGSYGSFSGGKAPKYYTFDDDTGDSPARASPGRPSSTANDGGAASSSSGNPSTSSNSNGGGSSNANRAGSSSGGGGATYAGSSYARASSAGSHQSYRWGQQSYTYTGPGGGPYTSGYTNTNTNTNARSGGAYGSGSSSSSSYFRSSGTTPSSAAMKHMQSLGLAISACGPGGKLESRVLTKAYREAALRWHPDKWINGTQEQRQAAEKNFKDISVAYQVLKESHTF